MRFVAQHRKSVLAGERRDPDVIWRDGVASPLQFQAHVCVSIRRRLSDIRDLN